MYYRQNLYGLLTLPTKRSRYLIGHEKLTQIVFFSCIEKDVGKLCKASHFFHLIIDFKCISIFLASGENVVLKLELESDDEEEKNEPNEADKENLPDNELLTPMKEGSPGLKVKDEVTSQDSQADSQEEGEEEEDTESVGMVQTPGGLPSSNPVHNLWSEDKNHAQLPDLIHDKPFVSDAFKQVSDKTPRILHAYSHQSRLFNVFEKSQEKFIGQ